MSDSRIKGEKPCNLGAYVKCPIPARVFSDCVAWGCKGYTTTPATSNETHLLNLVWKEEFGTKVSFFTNTSNGNETIENGNFQTDSTWAYNLIDLKVAHLCPFLSKDMPFLGKPNWPSQVSADVVKTLTQEPGFIFCNLHETLGRVVKWSF